MIHRRLKGFPLALTTAGIVLLGGCVLPDQLSRLQKDVADLQSQLQHLKQEHSQSNEKLEQITEGLSAEGEGIGRVEFADVKLRLDEISRQQTMLDERLIDAYRRMDLLSQNLQENRELIRQFSSTAALIQPPELDPATGKPPGAATPGRSSAAVPSAEALYNAAYADFSKGNYALAISGFEEYSTRYPDSDLADNALYWIGECHFSQGGYGQAIVAFDQLLERYPVSDRAAAANLKKGLGYLEQNQIRQAIVQLRFVQNSYPRTDEARIAGDKLSSLGAVNR